MPVYVHEVFIARPVDAVFEAVANVTTHPKWQAGLIEAYAKTARPREGETGVEVRRLLGRTVRFPYEITHFDPPQKWGFRALNGPLRPSAILSFRATGLGTTIVSQFTIPGLAGWFAGPLLLRQQKRNYQVLKTLLESGTV